MSRILGLVLAAGEGRRMGMPKALVRGVDGVPWSVLAVRTLLTAGCDAVLVVLGAEADAARALLPDDSRVRVVVARAWAGGLGSSLRAGLLAAAEDTDEADALLVTLVDLPGLPVVAVDRVIGDDPGRSSLRRAVFDDRPGHPVLIGRDHWDALAGSLSGDRGAGAYLTKAGARPVQCEDLWDGEDRDAPDGGCGPRSVQQC
jgi:CTP:molybdopterin cytidylyltransferase MocA